MIYNICYSLSTLGSLPATFQDKTYRTWFGANKWFIETTPKHGMVALGVSLGMLFTDAHTLVRALMGHKTCGLTGAHAAQAIEISAGHIGIVYEMPAMEQIATYLNQS